MDDEGRPGWVHRLNALGEAVGDPARLVSLDPDELVETAMGATGCADFGGDSWVEPYRTLLRSLDDEAALTTLGRLMCRHDILRMLRNRLQLAPLLADVASDPISEPVFVIGPARSGTTILFELLSQDDRFRTPATWEVHHPVPPPEASTYDTDGRIDLADREARLWNDVRPAYETMHEEGGRLPKECIFITAHEFNSDYWTAVANVPSYNATRGTWDAELPYRYHRSFLQVLQSRFRRECWLLKAPSHMAQLRTLFAVYPDARIVHTHRDPRMTVPSTASLLEAFRRMRSDAPVSESAFVGIGMGYLLNQVIEWRTTGAVPDAQFVDVHYRELMDDPLATMGRLYEQLGWKLSSETSERVVSYLGSKPRGKHGAHTYSLADYGLTDEDVEKVFGSYIDHYGVARERGER